MRRPFRAVLESRHEIPGALDHERDQPGFTAGIAAERRHAALLIGVPQLEANFVIVEILVERDHPHSHAARIDARPRS